MSEAAAPGLPANVGAQVQLAGLTRRYGSGPAAITALDDVSVTIRAGEAVALVGPSGSGKSTLLHLVGAMDRPTAGTITVGGQSVHDLTRPEAARYRRRIGFVFQRFHLLAALSALDNVLTPLLPLHLRANPETKARTLLEQVGLAGREGSLPAQLSGGQQQRVAIARALINDPVVILADEPTGNLDTSTGADIITLLMSLRDQRGTTLLVATHGPAIAARCDRTVHLLDGRITPNVVPG
jgi:putative ABC transport system ATP-binding protein